MAWVGSLDEPLHFSIYQYTVGGISRRCQKDFFCGLNHCYFSVERRRKHISLCLRELWPFELQNSLECYAGHNGSAGLSSLANACALGNVVGGHIWRYRDSRQWPAFFSATGCCTVAPWGSFLSPLLHTRQGKDNSESPFFLSVLLGTVWKEDMCVSLLGDVQAVPAQAVQTSLPSMMGISQDTPKVQYMEKWKENAQFIYEIAGPPPHPRSGLQNCRICSKTDMRFKKRLHPLLSL